VDIKPNHRAGTAIGTVKDLELRIKRVERGGQYARSGGVIRHSASGIMTLSTASLQGYFAAVRAKIQPNPTTSPLSSGLGRGASSHFLILE